MLGDEGWAILQVPINYEREETLEDLSIVDPLERRRRYGREDHVRLYGRDYVHRLAEEGFSVTKDDYASRLEPGVADRYRIDQSEAVYFCRTRPR